MIAVVLAAGLATRLRPLTADRPKALLDVAGRAALDWSLDALWDVPALERVVVRIHARFAAAFERWRAQASFPVPLTLLSNDLGDPDRAHGALRDLELTRRTLPESADLLVCAADNLPRFSLGPLARACRDTRTAQLHVRVCEGTPAPRRHGIVEIDATGRVTRFEEKPEHPRSNLLATSLYAWPAAVGDLLSAYLAGGHNPDAPGHFLAWLAPRFDVYAVRCPGALLDAGSLDGLERARTILTRPDAPLDEAP